MRNGFYPSSESEPTEALAGRPNYIPKLYATSFDPRVTREANAIVIPSEDELLADEKRLPLTGITIDPEVTGIRGNAISLLRYGADEEGAHDPAWFFAVTVPDVQAFVRKNSLIDREALRRVRTSSPTSGTSPTRLMLPPSLLKRLSLDEGTTRPGLSLVVRFKPDMEPEDAFFVRSAFTNEKAFTFEEFDDILYDRHHDDHEALSPYLRLANSLNTGFLREFPQFSPRNPYIEEMIGPGKVKPPKPWEEVNDNNCLSNRMFGRLMMLANCIFGSFLAENRRNGVYMWPEKSEGEHLRAGGVRDIVTRTRYHVLSPEATGGYARFTAPLRESGDLINQRIAVASIDGLPDPYSPNELHRIIDRINLCTRNFTLPSDPRRAYTGSLVVPKPMVEVVETRM